MLPTRLIKQPDKAHMHERHTLLGHFIDLKKKDNFLKICGLGDL